MRHFFQISEFQTINKATTGLLFFEMLQFYTTQINIKHDIIQIRTNQHIKPEDIRWANKKMNIEGIFISVNFSN